MTSGTAAFTDNTIAQGQRRLPSTWFVLNGARPVVSGDTARCRGLTSEGSCVSSDTARRGGALWAWSLQDQSSPGVAPGFVCWCSGTPPDWAPGWV